MDFSPWSSSWGGQRYNSFNRILRETFGARVYKVGLRLERFYQEALDIPGVAGLSIATRPDCAHDDVLGLIAEIAHRTYLWLALGLESMHDKTLRWVNRGHSLHEFKVG